MGEEILLHDALVLTVGGEFVPRDDAVQTMDPDAVHQRATEAAERFANESDWEIDLGGADPPGPRSLLSDLPKRGPTRLLGRLALQSLRNR